MPPPEVPEKGGIGDAVIDPGAEPSFSRSGNGLANAEAESYDVAKLRHEMELAKHSGGYLGRLFGTGQSAATNIAGVVIVVCLIMVCMLALFGSGERAEDFTKVLIGVVLTALGYLFGASSRK